MAPDVVERQNARTGAERGSQRPFCINAALQGQAFRRKPGFGDIQNKALALWEAAQKIARRRR